jgi:hypothetical protein
VKPWQRVFREGILPQLGRAGLLALREALADDAPQLLQGATTDPAPMPVCWDWDCQGACPLAFAVWQQHGARSVRAVEDDFAELCFACDRLMGEPAATRWFTTWWDETDRALAVPALLEEVERSLAEAPAAA